LEAQAATPNDVEIVADKLPDISIKAALALREELDTPIPRAEVEQMHQVVMAELDKIQPGCHSTIVGGFVLSESYRLSATNSTSRYRRGKPQSNDVDIVISHSDLRSGAGLVKGLCAKLTQHLHKLGMLPPPLVFVKLTPKSGLLTRVMRALSHR
jgi:DNA polymerase mu